MQKITYLIFPILLGLLAGHASAQTTYKCKGADGTVQFSDRPCKGGVPVRVKTQPDSPERNAESDARLQRVANTVEQGRTQQRANTKSVNPGTAVPERTN